MSILISAKTTNDRRVLEIARGSLIELRLGVLCRVDALMNTHLAENFKLQFRHFSNEAAKRDMLARIIEVMQNYCNNIKKNTANLKRYGLAAEDVDCILAFAIDADVAEQMSVSDAKSLAKWLDIFVNLENAKDELGNQYPFWHLPECTIFERKNFKEDFEESEGGGIKRLYDVVGFAAKHDLSVRFS